MSGWGWPRVRKVGGSHSCPRNQWSNSKHRVCPVLCRYTVSQVVLGQYPCPESCTHPESVADKSHSAQADRQLGPHQLLPLLLLTGTAPILPPHHHRKRHTIRPVFSAFVVFCKRNFFIKPQSFRPHALALDAQARQRMHQVQNARFQQHWCFWPFGCFSIQPAGTQTTYQTTNAPLSERTARIRRESHTISVHRLQGGKLWCLRTSSLGTLSADSRPSIRQPDLAH